MNGKQNYSTSRNKPKLKHTTGLSNLLPILSNSQNKLFSNSNQVTLCIFLGNKGELFELNFLKIQ